MLRLASMARQSAENHLTRGMLCRFQLRIALGGVLLSFASAVHAWDYEGHRMVNQVALASLPKEYPQFVYEVAAAERVAFLSGEPDRWRNVPDLPLKHAGNLEHFCDLEYVTDAGLDWATVPSFRYEFVVQYAAARKANEKNFQPLNPAQNTDRTREWPGFAPWAITEHFGRLRAAFSYLKVFEELGTPDEIKNAQANIVYLMGVMGHFVGDCSQPLHTTKHYNGWVGANPKGYTTWNRLHSWIDGGIIARTGLRYPRLAPRVTPAQPISLAARTDGRDPMFVAVVEYLMAQNRQVEPLYQLELAGKLGQGENGVVADETRDFIEARLLEGGQMLGAIWLTAFRSAVPDTFLRGMLIRRQTASGPGATKANP
jgi:hypothetical protein